MKNNWHTQEKGENNNWRNNSWKFPSFEWKLESLWAKQWSDSWVQEAGGDGGSEGREKEEENYTEGGNSKIFQNHW